MKQKQLLMTEQKIEEAQAKRVAQDSRNEVTGKYGTAIELLVNFAKENEEDTRELRAKLREVLDEDEATEREILLQTEERRRKQRVLAELDSKLQTVRKEYKSIHPNLQKHYDTDLEREIAKL